MLRDPFMLSPLFATSHNFFNFAPNGLFPTPRIADIRGFGYEDFMLRAATPTANMSLDYQNKMDKIVNNLRAEIQHNLLGEVERHREEFDLDIDLINESYGIAPMSKSSLADFKFPQSTQQKSVGTSFRKLGDVISSPNSSYIAKKKN